MPGALLLYYRERDDVPALASIERLSARAQVRALYLLEQLQSEGHNLRRPHAAPLRDEIYELRVDDGNVHHRLLYLYYGQQVVVLTHGLRKCRPARLTERCASKLPVSPTPPPNRWRSSYVTCETQSGQKL